MRVYIDYIKENIQKHKNDMHFSTPCDLHSQLLCEPRWGGGDSKTGEVRVQRVKEKWEKGNKSYKNVKKNIQNLSQFQNSRLNRWSRIDCTDKQ